MRRRYRVYLCSRCEGVYGSGSNRTFIGETVAASGAQAVNNVRWRTSGKRPNAWAAGDYAGGGYCSFRYEAEEVKED